MTTGGLGERVRSARLRRGWSRETLASRADVSFAAVVQIENRRRCDPRASTLGAMAVALGVTIDHLVGQPPLPAPLIHSAFSYEGTDALVSTVVPFVLEGVEKEEAVAVITPRTKLRALRAALGDVADAVDMHESERWYTSPSVAQARYRDLTDRYIADGCSWIRIVGEQTWSAKSKANPAPWARYESIMNLALAHAPVTVLCPYDRRSAPAAAITESERIHPSRFDRGRLEENAEYVGPIQFLFEHDGDRG